MPDADRGRHPARHHAAFTARQIVDDFHFTFKDGKVVDFDAGVGK